MKFKGLLRNEYATRWDNAYPVGNGTIGCLVFGNPLNEKIVTSHEDLFIPMPENNDARPFKTAGCIDEMRKLILEGKYKEGTELFLRTAEKDGYPFDQIIWTNPFETATEIYLDTDDKGDVSDYASRLDFSTGELVTSFKCGDNAVKRRSFASRTRNVFVMLCESSKPSDYTVSVGENEEIHDMAGIDHRIEDDLIVCRATHAEEESGYVSALKIETDGTVERMSGELADRGLLVKGATRVMILFTITPWQNRLEAAKVKAVRTLNDTPVNYDVLLKEHLTIHAELFGRVRVTLSESDKEYTNDELKAMAEKDGISPELLERMADYGRYLEITSFGKQPPNLQGVYNGTANPPWSADYTLDENIQMMMWQVLPGSLPEFARVYFDWLESYVDDFKKNAKTIYGVDGVFCASRVSLTDGIHRHFSFMFPMAFWTAGAGWLSSVYEDFYEYTGDKNILLRGVKYWKEVVKFYEGFLITDEKGKFMFVPSYSPENTPLGHDSPTAINATMDVAIAKEVYTNLINACEILDIEGENIDKWRDELSRFPDYTVNEDGALKEWLPEFLKDDYHHRHSSHLYPVFPGNEALRSGNEDLFRACHKAAELRLIDGVDAISGWGLAHLANICARLNDSDLWYKALNRLITVFTYDNLFTTHNEHVLFQMDANLGITAALYEAFLYSDTEKVILFPVISDKFKFMCVEGLRAKGQIHVIRLELDDDTVIAHLENQGRKPMRILSPKGFSFENGDREVMLNPGGVVMLRAVKRS